MTTATKTRKRVKPARFICLALPPCEGHPGIIRITVGKQTTDYQLLPIPSEIGGSAFEITKLGDDTDGEVYHVRLTADDRQDSCDCKGYVRHGHCKHRDGLAVLRHCGRI